MRAGEASLALVKVYLIVHIFPPFFDRPVLTTQRCGLATVFVQVAHCRVGEYRSAGILHKKSRAKQAMLVVILLL